MSVGFWQILLVVLLVVVLFGAGRLPRIMSDLAQGLKAFRKNLDDDSASSSASGSKKEKKEKL